MKSSIVILGLLLGFVPFILFSQTNTQSKPCLPCGQMKDLRLPEVTILKAESFLSDTTSGITVPFCRLTGRISKEINFELILPQQWNGRFLMSGGGGFVGSVENYLRNRANDGYASAGTDTGHQGGGASAEWALNNMERQINFGRLGVHRTAVVSKSLIHYYYCSAPSYSYFFGCSRGGGQAMVEAQFYPEDFDGFVAGAPAFSWPALGAKFIQISQKNYPNPKDLSKPVITQDNLKLLQQNVLLQCDQLDGVSDRIINDPRICNFDFSKLPLCPDGKASASCFTREQLSAIEVVYSPLQVDKHVIYPGFPFGLEGEGGSWDAWISGTSPFLQNAPSLHFQFSTNMYKYLVFNDPSWDYSQYHFQNFFDETEYASAYLDATQTDYLEFKKMKRKMIMYHGWNDAALSAFKTIEHYDEALEKDKDLPSSIRLFLLPGVLHCGGGTGPDNIDWIKHIQNWVENNQAPDRLVVSKMDKGKATMTRPVYPYPKVAVYNGSGDPNQEKNYKLNEN